MAVCVIHGSDEETFNSVIGLEFSEAISIVRRALSIPEEVTDVRLNGQEATVGTRIVRDGDTINFYKRSGKKGC